MSKENMLVFATPILDNKTITLKENPFSSDQEVLFHDLGISKYKRWIQSIGERYFLVHQIKGANPELSIKRLKEKISERNPTALAVKELYEDTLGINIEIGQWIPSLNKLTDSMDMHLENPSQEPSKEYCFVYSILPSKREKLINFYQTEAIANSTAIENIQRFRGIDKTQVWIQEASENTFVIFYQKIVGPVSVARESI